MSTHQVLIRRLASSASRSGIPPIPRDMELLRFCGLDEPEALEILLFARLKTVIQQRLPPQSPALAKMTCFLDQHIDSVLDHLQTGPAGFHAEL